jgi:hypothetical protein
MKQKKRHRQFNRNAETIVSDKKNRSVTKRNEREREYVSVCMCLCVREKKSVSDVAIALLIIYLIDQLSCFLSALFSVNQPVCLHFYPIIYISRKIRNLSSIYLTYIHLYSLLSPSLLTIIKFGR